MRQAALVDLLLWSGLLPEQSERLARHPLFAGPTLQKIIADDALMAALRTDIVSNELFQTVMARGARFQRRLVEHTGLTTVQLELLAEQGVSRTVRTVAVTRLNRRPSH